MEDRKLQRLKEVLSVPTHSRQEDLMIEYLEKTLTEKGYEYQKDSIGNIYVTKGDTEYFPCFVAHTDTVHSVNLNLKVIQLEENNKTILTGIDSKTYSPSGIGGDDKCGVFLCLEMLDKLDNVKIALFVSEEIGCVGSRQADPEFFKNVGYAIQYDSPKGNSMSMSLMGKELFGKSTNFGEKVSPLILEHGINDWARHPYTDIWPLMEKFGFSCLNLAAGYHRYHTENEYVVVEEVQNAFELGLKLHETLGENFYERPQEKEEEEKSLITSIFGGYGSSNKQTLNEEEEDDLHFDEEDTTNINNDYNVGEFEDFWDYEDFNGGYSIQKFGKNDYDVEFEW